MRLNTMKPGPGSKRKRLRVGRGASAGQGKTCGKGGKGQKARKGGYHKVGFEGGQVPLQRRLPKVGFRSAMQQDARGSDADGPRQGEGRADRPRGAARGQRRAGARPSARR